MTHATKSPRPQSSRQLEDDQLTRFDQEYVQPDMWSRLTHMIARTFNDGRFTFLDIGGGNGRFTDRILAAYPHSRGVLLDNAEVLLALNKTHPRKRIVNSSIEAFVQQEGDKFDIINLNWLLHHLVVGSYGESRALQLNILTSLPLLLSPRGHVSVFENMYNGLLFKNLPGRLIYQLTSNQLIAPVIRTLGANSASCGVCFLSEVEWKSAFATAGFSIRCASFFEDWKLSLFRRVFLHLGTVRVGHFWLARAVGNASSGRSA